MGRIREYLMMSDYLVLVDHNIGLSCNESNADIELLYRSNSMMNRIIRKILLRCRLPFYKYFLGDWYRYTKEYKCIIMFDTGNAQYLIPILRRKKNAQRIILWYWNSVSKTISPELFYQSNVELWSFDTADCQKYRMRYNTQFYISTEICKSIKQFDNYESKQDVYFVGTDKGRIDDLNKLKNFFDKNGITYKFHVVGDTKKEIKGLKKNYDNPIDYDEVIKSNLSSRAIVDLVSKGQNGLTLRPLEALNLKRKLITNMESIIQHRIYNPNNIFIIGKDSETKLKKFIDSPYDETDYDQLVEYYSFKQWLNRFDKIEE